MTARFDPTKPLPKLRVWGRAPGGPVTMDVDLARASANAGIGTRWARARIASREAARVHGADPAVVRADVIELAKRFSLAIVYTSFVVVADESFTAQGASREGAAGTLPPCGTTEPLLLLIGVILCALGACIVQATA